MTDRIEERRELAGPRQDQTAKDPQEAQQREESPFEDEDDDDIIEDQE